MSRGNKYNSSNVRWLVEFYPFEDTIPSDNDGFQVPTGPSAIISSVKDDAQRILDLINSQKQQLNIKDGQIEIIRGLKRVSINRNKSSPDAKCSLSFVGPLPRSAYVGVWVVVSSVNGKEGAKNLVRFVGQIESIDVNYNVRQDNLLIQQSSITVREWSSVLKYSLRFDRYSLQSAEINTSNLSGRDFVGAQALLGKKAVYDDISKVIAKTYDPLVLAQTILDLAGALNKDDALEETGVAGLGLPGKAVTMPSVPQSVMARLRVTDAITNIVPKFDSQNPFQSGFVNLATGTLTEEVHTDDAWDGVFETGGIQDIKSKMSDGYARNPLKPRAQGIGAIMQSCDSIWGLITGFCEPLVYEYYTDIWYEQGTNGLISKPTIVMRDLPFAMDTLAQGQEDSYSDIKKFTAYDNLPRIFIDDVNIIGFRANTNILNSPNYFMVEYNNTGVDANLARVSSVKDSIKRLDPEMRRFGGHDLPAKTNFLGLPGTDDPITAINFNGPPVLSGGSATDSIGRWFRVLRDLLITWHAYNYQMGNGVLTIKDNNYAISIGWNVTFDFGEHTLCGHVDAISLDFYIDDDGLEVSNMNLTLSRIVEVDEQNGLSPIDPSDWGDLFRKGKPIGVLAGLATKVGSIFKTITNGNQ